MLVLIYKGFIITLYFYSHLTVVVLISPYFINIVLSQLLCAIFDSFSILIFL